MVCLALAGAAMRKKELGAYLAFLIDDKKYVRFRSTVIQSTEASGDLCWPSEGFGRVAGRPTPSLGQHRLLKMLLIVYYESLVSQAFYLQPIKTERTEKQADLPAPSSYEYPAIRPY